MKGIVRLSVLLSLCLSSANADAGSKDEQSKQLFNTANDISSQQKPNLLSYQQITHYGDKLPEQIVYQQRYQPRTQQLQQVTPYQNQQEPMIRKPNLVSQHQPMPVAMVIIAQPAYIPASMLQQGNVAQQLLNFFHGNSQSRYQYIPVRNIQQQNIPAAVQSQHVSQYVPYQPQQEISQSQPSAPTAQAQSTQFYRHEALPTPQALISPHHASQHEALPNPQALISTQHVVPLHEAIPTPQALISPHHLSQQNAVEGRELQYNVQPQQQFQYQHQQSYRQNQQLLESQHNEEQQLQQDEHQQSAYQKPLQLTDISQLAQQAAQHFLTNGGLQSGSRTAPAIITGLEHFSPEQQEKIKAQLGVHFGSPLKPLNLGGEQGQTEQKNSMISSTKYHPDHKQMQNNQKFVPSIEVKDGEITQNNSGSDKM